ncbi:hypothetical protein [Paenibacillus luteus]|uniref:hypothetical protein n=1 Tax=Paenibacillus luteus TaxID=2545753 RepID=UPI0019D5C3F8|nr:hypothetical protein [Paenibacillus luteus]
MGFDTVVIWVYLVYLAIPFYLGSRIATKILIRQRSGTNAIKKGETKKVIIEYRIWTLISNGILSFKGLPDAMHQYSIRVL